MANNIGVVAAMLREVPAISVDEILTEVDRDVGALGSFTAEFTGDADNHGKNIYVAHWGQMARHLQRYGAALLALGKAMERQRPEEARH